MYYYSTYLKFTLDIQSVTERSNNKLINEKLIQGMKTIMKVIWIIHDLRFTYARK